MKITSKMKLDRLARQTVVTASTRAGWCEVRRLLVAHSNGLDTRSVKIGQWWAIQQAAWATDIRNAPAPVSRNPRKAVAGLAQGY